MGKGLAAICFSPLNSFRRRMESILDNQQRAHLSAFVGTDAFKVVDSLLKDEVHKYHVALVNAPADDDKKIIAAYQMEKAASQIYIGLVNRINEEVMLYRNMTKAGDVMPDVTENLGMDNNVQELITNIPEGEY